MMELEPITEKLCNKCHKVKPVSEFYEKRQFTIEKREKLGLTTIIKSGFYPECKECIIDRNRIYRERKANEGRK